MKVTVLGATGMLGSMLVGYLSKYYQVVATVRNKEYKPPKRVELKYLDAIRWEGEEIENAIRGCSWVINAIGAIPQRGNNGCEMMLANGLFPQQLEVARELQSDIMPCRVIHVTTDCVYSGKKGLGHCESATIDCMDTYGESKFQGEVDGLDIIRCSLIGIEPEGTYSLLGKFLSLPRNATFDGYTNHFWNGVTTLHFAKICRGMIEKPVEFGGLQTQHLVPADSMSKYELLKLFALYFNRDDITIIPVKAPVYIDRILATEEVEINKELWKHAGYSEPPTIERMVKEFKEENG